MSNKHVHILLFFLMAICAAPAKVAAQTPVSFQLFYDQLSPYGTWVDDPEYGYAWIPNVERGFTPYATNGYWALTDAGWTWVSDYAWGWAPFHYGRWYTDAIYGPMWIPDNEWGPAWVSWRRSNSYYGWAPMQPGYGHGHNESNDHWTFVRNRDFGRNDLHNRYVSRSRNVAIINASTVINNNRQNNAHTGNYNAGPDRAEAETRSGRKFEPVAIEERNEPGQHLSANQIHLYRPQVQKEGPGGSKPAPTRVGNIRDVKTTAQKNTDATPQKANQPPRQQTPPQQRTNQPPKKQRPQPAQKRAPTRQPAPSQQTRPGSTNRPQQTNPPTRTKPNLQPSSSRQQAKTNKQ